MWLNMAVQDAAPAGLTVGVRKPGNVPWEVWSDWSEATKLAYVNGEDLGAVCGTFFPYVSNTNKAARYWY